MPMAEWPETLNPLPLRDAYTFKPHADIHRSEIGGGNYVQRQPFGESEAFPKLTLPMTPAQLDIFNAFYAGDLFNGRAWFLMPIVFPAGLTTCTVKFDGTVKSVFDDPDWLVSFELLVRDAPYELEGGPYLTGLWGDDTLADFAAGVGDFVHVEWPAYFEEVA